MYIREKKAYLEENDEVLFCFKLGHKKITPTDVAEMLYENRFGKFDSDEGKIGHGNIMNVRIDKSYRQIHFTVENQEDNMYRLLNKTDRCTFDTELLFGKNNMVYGKASNFQSFYNTIFESSLCLNKPQSVINLIADLDREFGDFTHTSFRFDRDGVNYVFPIEAQEVEQDLVHRDTEKRLFENRVFDSNESLQEMLNEFKEERNDGTPFFFVTFKNCKFKNVDFDKFQKDFEDLSVSFAFCHLESVHMSGKTFAEAAVLFDRNVGVSRSSFDNIAVIGDECSFYECKFNNKCDLHNLQLSDFTNCEGLEKSNLLFDSNLVKDAHFIADGMIYVEERIGATSKPKVFDLDTIQKDSVGVFFTEEDVSLFYEKNKDLLKDRIFKSIRDVSLEEAKVMTYDDKKEYFRKALIDDIACCSYIVKTSGEEMEKDGKFFEEQYLLRGNMYNEISRLAVNDLLKENKICSNAYGFYDTVEEKKLSKPKSNKADLVKQNDLSM